MYLLIGHIETRLTATTLAEYRSDKISRSHVNLLGAGPLALLHCTLTTQQSSP